MTDRVGRWKIENIIGNTVGYGIHLADPFAGQLPPDFGSHRGLGLAQGLQGIEHLIVGNLHQGVYLFHLGAPALHGRYQLHLVAIFVELVPYLGNRLLLIGTQSLARFQFFEDLLQ